MGKKQSIPKLNKAMDHLERKMEKLSEDSIQYKRLMRSYVSKEKQRRKAMLLPKNERTDLMKALEGKTLDNIPDEAW